MSPFGDIKNNDCRYFMTQVIFYTGHANNHAVYLIKSTVRTMLLSNPGGGIPTG